MKRNILHPKIASWINSCTTYDQIQTCFNFMNLYTCIDIKYKILGLIQKKAYEMRNTDLKEHSDWLKNLVK